MTAKEVQAKADAAVQPLVASIVAFQETWVLTHKGYWQGLRTPTATPKNGADTPPEKNVKPVADAEAKAWAEVAVTMPITLPCSVEVFTHDGPVGKGFSVIAHVEVGAQKFRKAVGFGRHAEDSEWVEVIERQGR